MNSINITITNLTNNIYIHINCENNIMLINNKQKLITQEIISNLLRIIRTWNNKYINNNIIDAEITKIEIHTNQGIDIIECNGNYPPNYQEFKKWVGEVYE